MARSRGIDTQTLVIIAGLGALVYFLMSKAQASPKPGGPPPSQPYMPPTDFGLRDPTTWDDYAGPQPSDRTWGDSSGYSGSGQVCATVRGVTACSP